MAAATKKVQAGSSRSAVSSASTSANTSSSATGKHIVHWFRKGLRLHDNPALREGLVNAVTFRCIFIIDPWFTSSSNVSINKWRFLLQCLEDLDTSLRKLNSRLFVVRGQPADALPKLFREWGTTLLSFEEDPEPYGRARDHIIMTKCKELGINVSSCVSHTLYKLERIIEQNGGKAPLTYHQFQAIVANMPPPPFAEPVISTQTLNGAITPINKDHDKRFGVPTLEELGFDTEGLKPPVWVGGESEALARLERYLERKAWVATFGRPKMTPQSLLASQTGLSPYLRFGCLSARLFYYQLSELYIRVKRAHPPLSLHGQILWREFFYCAATKNPNFDRMQGNPICVQIPWEKNQEALAKWANGHTGFPWIDAIMIQLREEGWIHHLARHAVACFLTRGDLWISWEEGMKVFDELMLDADWSVNAGMWMWLSCSSFFQQFFHCFCPVRFGRKADPNGDFIRKYIPILHDIPTRYIHEPWMAPETVQQSARCVIGRDYPMPMVDHASASQINLERIKQVYAQLAKYKPQGTTVSPEILTTPQVIQSSPSPTSIITSINQPNYICCQSSSTPPPQTNNTDDSNIFLRPSNNIKNLMKPPLKHVVIVPQNRVVSRIQKSDRNVLLNGQASNQNKKIQVIIATPRPDKAENYDFKNLAIHNHIQQLSPAEAPAHSSIQGQSVEKTETYQETIKITELNANNYQAQSTKCSPENSKFYMSNLTENGETVQNAHLHDDVAQNFTENGKQVQNAQLHDEVGQTFIVPSSRNFIMKGKSVKQVEKAKVATNDAGSFPAIEKGNSSNE